MENISDYNIHIKLKELRSSLNLTQGDFAEKIGMKQSAYSMIENGNNKISVDALKKAIIVFNVDSNYFFRNTPLNVNLNVNNKANLDTISNDNIIIYDRNAILKHYDDLVNSIQTVYGLILRHGDNSYLTLEMINDLKNFSKYGFSAVLDLLLVEKGNIDKKLENLTKEVLTAFPDAVSELKHSINVLGVTMYGSQYKNGSFVHFDIEDIEEEIKERDSNS